LAAGAGFATGTPGTRFNAGQAIHFTGLSAATFLTKTIPTNESTLFVAVAFYRSGALSGTTAEFAFNLRDGATNQCSIVFESSGKIVLKSGSESGTVLATYTGAFAQDVWPLVVKRKMSYAWAHTLQSIHTCDHPAVFNADARVRCLALWHVCKGIVPPRDAVPPGWLE